MTCLCGRFTLIKPRNRSLRNILATLALPFALCVLHGLDMHTLPSVNRDEQIESARLDLEQVQDELNRETDPATRENFDDAERQGTRELLAWAQARLRELQAPQEEPQPVTPTPKHPTPPLKRNGTTWAAL
jgi:hypothetical protein